MNVLASLFNPKLAQDDSAGAIATSPGIIGWIATFFMAVAAGFIIRDMVKRIRKVRYVEEIKQQISEEEAAIDEARELERERLEREGK